MRYEHLFFDLDHTLWDFEKNAWETLGELYVECKLSDRIASIDVFWNIYNHINDQLWREYREGKISKTYLRKNRFQRAFQALGIQDEKIAAFFEEAYVLRCPMKKNLIPGSLETVGHLAEKYQLHIITNGFEETQLLKLKNTGLESFFKSLTTSDKAGINKPDQRIFLAALKEAGARQRNSVMIGDHLIADIVGARKAGLDQVYFNPKNILHQEKVTYEIRQMDELRGVF